MILLRIRSVGARALHLVEHASSFPLASPFSWEGSSPTYSPAGVAPEEGTGKEDLS
jgi:hypothetical protein